MKIIDAKSELEALLAEYVKRITEAGLISESEIEGYDKNGDACAYDSAEATGIFAVVYVGANGMSREDMLGCAADFAITKSGEISDVKFADEIRLFRADTDKLIEELASAEDPAELIKTKCAEAEAEAEEAMKKLEHDVEMIEKIGKIAAISLIGIIVILGAIIAFL